MLSADVKSQNCDHLVRGIILDQHDTTILAFANIIIEGTGQKPSYLPRSIFLT